MLTIDKKICFVVQRYGLEVNGGAELLCRQMAERMVARCSEVHVLTTKAIDYITWKNEYADDEEVINQVEVHRFKVAHPRNKKEFDEINLKLIHGMLKMEEEDEWMEKQGPATPELIQYLTEHASEYDIFIFFTYLYYTTVMGLPIVCDKAILVPTVHDEPALKMRIFDDVFLKPRGFVFNTEEEQKLTHERYHNAYIPNVLGGAGVELPADISGKRFCDKYNLKRYIVYVGRIDEEKGCNQLFRYFLEYKKRNKMDLCLVLMGKPVIDIPQDDSIISLGFVDDQDKFDGMAGAELLVLPSEFESLSMVVLEAMSVRTPVMVYGKCPVLRGHCIKSNGAFFYNNFFEFEGQINYLLGHEEEKGVMIQNAYQYVQEHYQWDVILDRLVKMIMDVSN
ncbi:MAG: glycosyltransferase family 4 protein [Roseburia sp.]|nr:glycosyltransferase family 4 protein [Roseburia sp.]